MIIWYKPTLPPREISQLETLFSEPMEGKPEGYKQILVERPSLPGAVAASAWGQQLVCPKFNDKVFDAIRTFRVGLRRQGPRERPLPRVGAPQRGAGGPGGSTMSRPVGLISSSSSSCQ